jgi:VWFA-related protein
MRGIHPAVWFAAFACASLVARGAQEQRPTFRTAVDLVRVDALATDGAKPIRGLTAADFEVLDNGVAQRIDAVFGEMQPLDVLLVFDTSKSVEGSTLRRLKEAALAILRELREGDRAQLTTFSQRVLLPVPVTGDRSALGWAIDGIEASGSTALLDALYTALVSRDAGPNRSMILVFSDGRDNMSWLSEEQVVAVARETETVIYSVAYEPFVPRVVYEPPSISMQLSRAASGSIPDEKLLRELAQVTGGRLLAVNDAKRLQSSFVGLLTEMRSRYLLTYYPRGVPGAGWHELKVRLKTRSGRVTARPGYVAR